MNRLLSSTIYNNIYIYYIYPTKFPLNPPVPISNPHLAGALRGSIAGLVAFHQGPGTWCHGQSKGKLWDDTSHVPLVIISS